MRYHYRIDPKELSDNDWARLYQEWIYVQRVQLKAQASHTKVALQEVLYEIFNKLYGKKK